MKLAGGTGGAILAFLVFIGLVSLLPDSQWPELLLAVTVATLTVSSGGLRVCMGEAGSLCRLIFRRTRISIWTRRKEHWRAAGQKGSEPRRRNCRATPAVPPLSAISGSYPAALG